MDINQASQLIALYGSKFPGYSIPQLNSLLQEMDYNTASMLLSQTKDPTVSLIVSILLGSLGIDRFLIGDTVLGVLKLITCGGLGIWTIIDWFLIMEATKEKNMQMFTAMRY